MFEMNVPYDKGQMKIKLEDKNLAGVLEGRQSDYQTSLSENEIVGMIIASHLTILLVQKA